MEGGCAAATGVRRGLWQQSPRARWTAGQHLTAPRTDAGRDAYRSLSGSSFPRAGSSLQSCVAGQQRGNRPNTRRAGRFARVSDVMSPRVYGSVRLVPSPLSCPFPIPAIDAVHGDTQSGVAGVSRHGTPALPCAFRAMGKGGR